MKPHSYRALYTRNNAFNTNTDPYRKTMQSPCNSSSLVTFGKTLIPIPLLLDSHIIFYLHV